MFYKYEVSLTREILNITFQAKKAEDTGNVVYLNKGIADTLTDTHGNYKYYLNEANKPTLINILVTPEQHNVEISQAREVAYRQTDKLYMEYVYSGAEEDKQKWRDAVKKVKDSNPFVV